jgi:hypothetical protein
MQKKKVFEMVDCWRCGQKGLALAIKVRIGLIQEEVWVCAWCFIDMFNHTLSQDMDIREDRDFSEEKKRKKIKLVLNLYDSMEGIM